MEWKWDTTKTDFIPKSKRFNDITGMRFGRLVALYPAYVKNKRTYWTCLCDCGKECIIGVAHLPNGAIISCGCSHIDAHKELTKRKYKGYNDLSKTFYTQIVRSAKKRNIEFELTIEFLWELYLKQEKKCALSGVEITIQKEKCTLNTASLDRIDSSKGYIESNVQWVHKIINISKNSLSNDDFYWWCLQVVKTGENDYADCTSDKGLSGFRKKHVC